MGIVAGAAAHCRGPTGREPTRRGPCGRVPSLANGPVEKKKPHAKYQQQAHDATNKQRVAHGLKESRKQDCVQRFAVRQAKIMAQQESMFHQELGPIMAACDLNSVGENVAYGYPSGRSVVNDGWMNSEGHRANILNPDFKLMGIGARKGHDGRWYVAQVFGREA